MCTASIQSLAYNLVILAAQALRIIDSVASTVVIGQLGALSLLTTTVWQAVQSFPSDEFLQACGRQIIHMGRVYNLRS